MPSEIDANEPSAILIHADKEIEISLSLGRSLVTPWKQFPSHIHIIGGSPRVMVQVEPIKPKRLRAVIRRL